MQGESAFSRLLGCHFLTAHRLCLRRTMVLAWFFSSSEAIKHCFDWQVCWQAPVELRGRSSVVALVTVLLASEADTLRVGVPCWEPS